MRQFKIQKNLTNRSEISIEKYFNDVKKQKTITPEEEVELALRIKKGDKVALEKLVNANLKFVISVAKQYQNSGMEFGDLINEGNLGLIKAAEKFDETKGFKFISFAVWWIRQSIIEAISNKKRMIRIPSNKNLLSSKYSRALSSLAQNLEREPSVEEVCDFMEISQTEALSLCEISFGTVSMDKPISSEEGSSTLSDLMSDDMFESPENNLINESLQKDIDRALEILTKKESYVIKSLFGIGCKIKNKEDLAKEMCFTEERIRQLGSLAQKKIANSDKAKKLLLKYI